MTNNPIIAKLKMPTLQTKKVWYGLYGGHYSCIVFFSEKPKISDEPYYLPHIIDGYFYDLLDNEYVIIGCMWLEQFNELYPEAVVGLPTHIHITEVFEMELECFFNDNGRITSYDFHADGY